MLAYFHLTKEDIDYQKGGYYPDVLGITYSDFHDWTRRHFDKLMSSVKVKPYCKEVLEYFKKQKCEIILITARSTLCFTDPETTTKNWLKQNQIPYSKLIVHASDKKRICEEEKIDLFIDDSVSTCEKVSELGIPVYVMQSKLNEFIKTHLKWVSNWLEMEKLVKEELYGGENFNK